MNSPITRLMELAPTCANDTYYTLHGNGHGDRAEYATLALNLAPELAHRLRVERMLSTDYSHALDRMEMRCLRQTILLGAFTEIMAMPWWKRGHALRQLAVQVRKAENLK